MKTTTPSRIKSEEIYATLLRLIPGGVNSPVRACGAVGQLPLIAESGKGDLIQDADGNCYIDYCGSWGPLIHGHAHPEIIEAIQNQLYKGTTFGATTEIEAELAEQVVKWMPHIEQVRFVSSGTEATMSAIRLARGFTGRNLVIKFSGNYHGHADFLLVKAGSGVMNIAGATSKGIPEELISHTYCLKYNDEEAIRLLFNNPSIASQIACVILEPVAGNMGVVPATHSFIELLREKTEQHGALLIFDEVMTGFRIGLRGAAAYYGINPDLTCLGKIIGGGLPAAAFGGKREIMQFLAPLGPVYQAGTLSGNPLAMAAGLKSLQLLAVPGFYEELMRKTELLAQPIEKLIQEQRLNCSVQRVGSMFTLFFGKQHVSNAEEASQCNFEAFGAFFRFLFNHGVYIPPLQQEAWFISMAHTDLHLKQTAELICHYLKDEVEVKS